MAFGMCSSSRFGARLAWILALCPALALLGCGPGYESTADLYESISAETFPPLPETAVVPIADEVPFDRPYKVIGAIAFSTTKGPRWVDGALQWHARRAGADAVVVRRREAHEEPYTRYTSGYPYGPRISFGTSYGRYGRHGYVGTYYDWGSPWYDRGYAETYVRTRISVEADFVALLDKDTFGWIGLRPLDVGNTGELIVDDVDPRGPAARAGILPGDIVLRVDDFVTDGGLRDFLRHGPAPRIGVPVQIEVRRGAEVLMFEVVPEREPGW